MSLASIQFKVKWAEHSVGTGNSSEIAAIDLWAWKCIIGNLNGKTSNGCSVYISNLCLQCRLQAYGPFNNFHSSFSFAFSPLGQKRPFEIESIGRDRESWGNGKGNRPNLYISESFLSYFILYFV
jgi:hypothetical protein